MSSAGYSGTPLARKLGIKPNAVVWLIDAPPWLPDALAAEAPAEYVTSPPQRADVVLLFATSYAALVERFARAAPRLASNGGLWVCWPKRASGMATDLVEDAIRSHGLAAGLVDNKVCAVDATWSGLRFVIRVKDR